MQAPQVRSYMTQEGIQVGSKSDWHEERQRNYRIQKEIAPTKRQHTHPEFRDFQAHSLSKIISSEN